MTEHNREDEERDTEKEALNYVILLFDPLFLSCRQKLSNNTP